MIMIAIPRIEEPCTKILGTNIVTNNGVSEHYVLIDHITMGGVVSVIPQIASNIILS